MGRDSQMPVVVVSDSTVEIPTRGVAGPLRLTWGKFVPRCPGWEAMGFYHAKFLREVKLGRGLTLGSWSYKLGV